MTVFSINFVRPDTRNLLVASERFTIVENNGVFYVL